MGGPDGDKMFACVEASFQLRCMQPVCLIVKWCEAID